MSAHCAKTWLSALLVVGLTAGLGAVALSAQETATETALVASSATTAAAGSMAAVPYSLASIERGKTLYQRHCTECHGPDGKALMDVIADATDLTSPDLWYSGTERVEVFSSIRDGAGVSMPPYEEEFRDDQIWDLTNFTQSLWPENRRPNLEDE